MSTISKNMYGRPVVFYNWAVALHAILVVDHELRAQAYTERYKFTFVELICDVFDECGQLHVGTSVRKLTQCHTQRKVDLGIAYKILRTSAVQAPEFEG